MTSTDIVDSLSAYLRRAEAEATARARSTPLNAELPAGSTGHWYVVVTHPAHEKIAASHLSARRFATYLPEYERVFISRGVKKEIPTLLFRGYLFLFDWAIARNKRRIEACTGVSHLLTFAGTESFAIVPDAAIKEIQVLEWNYFFNGPNWKRPRRKKRNWSDSNDPVKVSPKSYFSGIEAIDEAGRNSLLHRALGLS